MLVEGRPSVGGMLCHNSSCPVTFLPAFFIVGATIVPGSDVTVHHVGINSTRTGLLDVMMNMGADIQLLNRREEWESRLRTSG